MQFKNIIIIYNPKSTGKSKHNAFTLQKILSKKLPQIPNKVVPTQYKAHAEELAYAIASKYKAPLIVSCSGDGGYNEVINGVMKAGKAGKNTICAVRASGNANDHSRTMQSKPLWKAIVSDEVTNIDLLRFTVTSSGEKSVRYAHSYAGLGLSPVVAKELDAQVYSRRRELVTVIKTFFKYSPFLILINNKILKVDSLVFSNINKMAKFIKFSKVNTPDNGMFIVTLFVHRRKRYLALNILKAVFGRLESSYQQSRYEFTALSDMPIQLDGEVMHVQAGSVIKVESANKALATIV